MTAAAPVEVVKDDLPEITHPSPAATFWRQATPGTTYWRCHIPARHLPGQSLTLMYDDLQRDGDRIVMPRQHGAMVWQFAGNMLAGTLMANWQHEGGRALLEVDDNYLTPGPGPSRWLTSDADKNGEDHSTIETNRRIAGFADGVICATRQLADAYSKVNPNVYVCPNSVDPDDWDEPVKPDDGILRIGWAASPSHIQDAPIVRRALTWAARQKDVEVVFLGQPLRDWGFPHRQIPWSNSLTDYRRSLQILDVGVCPLQDTAWSRCKSNVKALEYAMAGAFPLVQDVAPYQTYDGPTIRCRSARDWERAIRWCVVHRDAIRELAAEARAYVLDRHAIGRHIQTWREAVCESPS